MILENMFYFKLYHFHFIFNLIQITIKSYNSLEKIYMSVIIPFKVIYYMVIKTEFSHKNQIERIKDYLKNKIRRYA